MELDDELDDAQLEGCAADALPTPCVAELCRSYLTQIPRAINQARDFRCPRCPHRGASSPWPELSKPRRELALSGGPSETDLVAKELLCWYSKLSYKQAVLGFPVLIPRRHDHNRSLQMECGVDLLSHDAFSQGAVRDPLNADKQYTHYLPIWIDPLHGKGSRPLLKRQLASMCSQQAADNFRWEWALEILPKVAARARVSPARRSAQSRCS